MCIGVWTLEHPDYSLILCTNRDEILDRPTKDAHFHSFERESVGGSGNILSGRDEKAGGTWFGLSRSGRIALLTNITEPVKTFNSSRGYLVSSFLLSNSSHPLQDEVGEIIPQNASFAGFNLLVLAPASRPTEPLRFDARLVTNHGAGGTIVSRPLSDDERVCGGVSNGVDGEGGNDWPKVKHAIQDFSAALKTLFPAVQEAELTDRLFELLAWRSPDPVVQRSDLGKTVHVTPISLSLDGSSNMNSSAYGTRLSTVLLIGKDGNVLFIERDIWKLVDGKVTKADPTSERRLRFQLRTEAES